MLRTSTAVMGMGRRRKRRRKILSSCRQGDSGGNYNPQYPHPGGNEYHHHHQQQQGGYYNGSTSGHGYGEGEKQVNKVIICDMIDTYT